MLERERLRRDVVEFINTEERIPQDHLLRKMDSAVDFTHLYDFVEGLYCADNGRPGVDPVVLFKIVMIQHLYGIPSLRRTVQEIDMNMAYRWFLGYTLNEALPHFSTVSLNFRHRFTEETTEQVFAWILKEASAAGYLEPEAVFLDGTHIKASANLKKKIRKAVPEAAKRYASELMEEVNADREEHGKKPFDGPPAPPKEKEITVSATDPESGLFHKGEHQKCFAYEAHTACDRHNFVLAVEVTPGNVHDSVAFDRVYDKLSETFPELKTVVADAAYKTPWICKRVFGDGRVLSTAYKRPMTKAGNLEWWKYVYDEYNDFVICPAYHALHYATTNRDGYREYKSRSYICEKCPLRAQCTDSKNCTKTVTRHVWQDFVELAEDARYTPMYKELYRRRKETIERVFADAKEKHGMRYTFYRGLTQVTKWVRIKFAAMNLKKLATWKKKKTTPADPSPRSVFPCLALLLLPLYMRNPSLA
jgi:transposase